MKKNIIQDEFAESSSNLFPPKKFDDEFGPSSWEPAVYDCLSNSNFFNSTVPLDMGIYMMTPDFLRYTIQFFNLDKLQIQILEFLHKETMGYANSSDPNFMRRFMHMPISSASVRYGKSTPVLRHRFLVFKIRRMARIWGTTKSTLQRKLKQLVDIRVIQRDATIQKHNIGVPVGINYHTLKSIFSGIKWFGDDEKRFKEEIIPYIQNLADLGIIKIKLVKYQSKDKKRNRIYKGKKEIEDYSVPRILRIIGSIETLAATFPKNHKRKAKDLTQQERRILIGAFPYNKALISD